MINKFWLRIFSTLMILALAIGMVNVQKVMANEDGTTTVKIENYDYSCIYGGEICTVGREFKNETVAQEFRKIYCRTMEAISGREVNLTAEELDRYFNDVNDSRGHETKLGPSDHVYEYKYNDDATHFSDGTETPTCVFCGACDSDHVRTAEGTMLQGDFDLSYWWLARPDCTNSGSICVQGVQFKEGKASEFYNEYAGVLVDMTYSVQSCTLSADKLREYFEAASGGHDEEIPALGHDCNYVSNNDATEDRNATETGICTRCGNTFTREIPGTKIVKNNSFPFLIIIPDEYITPTKTNTTAEKETNEVAPKTVEEPKTNKFGNEIKLVTETLYDESGKISGSIETTTIVGSENQPEIVVEVKRNADGDVTDAKADTEIVGSREEAVLSGDIIKQIKDICPESCKVCVTLKSEKGNKLGTVTVDCDAILTGKTLYLYGVDKNGLVYVLDENNFKVKSNRTIEFKLPAKGEYELLSKTASKAMKKELLETCTLKKKSLSINVNDTGKIELNPGFSKNSIKEIIYTVKDDKIVTVGKKGKVTALKPGKTTIQVKIIMKNGTTKKLTQKISVKA